MSGSQTSGRLKQSEIFTLSLPWLFSLRKEFTVGVQNRPMSFGG